MFKVVSQPTFTHTVKVNVPVDGGFKEQGFRTRFRVIPLNELRTEDGEDGQKEALRRVIIEMLDLIDEQDQPMHYSDELRDQLLDVPYVRLALMQTYIAAITKARAGN